MVGTAKEKGKLRIFSGIVLMPLLIVRWTLAFKIHQSKLERAGTLAYSNSNTIETSSTMNIC